MHQGKRGLQLGFSRVRTIAQFDPLSAIALGRVDKLDWLRTSCQYGQPESYSPCIMNQ